MTGRLLQKSDTLTSSRRQRRLTALLTASHSCDSASVSSREAPGSTHPASERRRRRHVERETAMSFQFLWEKKARGGGGKRLPLTSKTLIFIATKVFHSAFIWLRKPSFHSRARPVCAGRAGTKLCAGCGRQLIKLGLPATRTVLGRTPPKHAAGSRGYPCRPRAPQRTGDRVRVRVRVRLAVRLVRPDVQG